MSKAKEIAVGIARRAEVAKAGFDRVRLGKAPIDTPRRAMGDLLGNAVRFGVVDDVLAAGEGIETMLFALRAAEYAHGRCAFGQSPLSHVAAFWPASALYRPRRRRCRRYRTGDP